MRLEYLWIESFKNLREFEVNFSPNHPIEVIVGRNGTGKSNLLEALIVIFRDLDLQPSNPTLRYKMRYHLNSCSVEIEASPHLSRSRLSVRVDGDRLSMKDLKSQKAEVLPSFVFGYYSGESERFDSHFDQHRTQYYRDLLDDQNEVPFRSLFLAETFHSQFVLLAFLLEPDAAIDSFLRDQLGVVSLASVEFVLREPEWSRKTDDRFWGARAAPRRLMERLYDESIAPVRETRPEGARFGRSTSTEHLFLHLDGYGALRKVYQHYESRTDFFKALESLVISELLYELKVTVKITDANEAISFKELSEGEQQLLIVLGLLRFTQTENSLLLLDEPDTHLNPAWSVRYTELMAAVMGDLGTSQVLMATHDPLVIAGLLKEQVVLLERSDEGRVFASRPDKDPRGMGVAALLTSEVYGLRSQLDLYTQEQLDEKRRLATLPERSERQNARLKELATVVDDVDMAATIRDPLYREFVRLVTALDGEQLPDDQPVARTAAELEERERAVREIAATVLRRGEEDYGS